MYLQDPCGWKHYNQQHQHNSQQHAGIEGRNDTHANMYMSMTELCTDFIVHDKHWRPRTGSERIEGAHFELVGHEEFKVSETDTANADAEHCLRHPGIAAELFVLEVVAEQVAVPGVFSRWLVCGCQS